MKKHLFTIITFLLVSISIGHTSVTEKVIAIKDSYTVVVIDNLIRQTIIRLEEVDCQEKTNLSAEKIRSGKGLHYKKYSKSIQLVEIEITS